MPPMLPPAGWQVKHAVQQNTKLQVWTFTSPWIRGPGSTPPQKIPAFHPGVAKNSTPRTPRSRRKCLSTCA